MTEKNSLSKALDETAWELAAGMKNYEASISREEVGHVYSLSQGIVWAKGLEHIKSEELVLFSNGVMGVVFDILPDRTGIVLLDEDNGLRAGDEVSRTKRILEVPVDMSLIGRIVDPLGRPLDGKGPIQAAEHLAVQREAPSIMARGPVTRPLQTGIKVIDALIPIGRGQRELILGDRQTGKTAVAFDTIINQADKDVLCIYCAIGQRSSSVAKLVAELKRRNAMEYSIVVVAEGSDPPGLQFIAPYAATSMAEFFMNKGQDVLIVYDDLTRHAIAYRQISLLLRRPPGREAYPGDIFYVHSRLLERSTRLRDEAGGGSITSLPVIETEAQNISAYIPTNLISITDGQIYLSPELFQKGVFPAIEVGKSVSRVGGKAQLGAYRKVAGDLRLSYSQFQELESFSRFGTRLDDATRKTLEHGKRVREVLKQNQYSPMAAHEQIAILMATNKGLLDQIPLENIAETEKKIITGLQNNPEITEKIYQAGKDDSVWQDLEKLLQDIVNEG
ncbi:MAG: alternate F1F0 ATPase, F1 subunit alpha [Desulfobulbaceae bacterium]|uniref:ATP synthase subunit alpha n=1 Tax=Candidatus Desulfobia pelagia TaxID=2841692 RepID=A0A8J6TEM9_9BACT|nr:alternate F1F0 ATPase, F1 subunit alpha [Candidatus Desulfobia pelagia]